MNPALPVTQPLYPKQALRPPPAQRVRLHALAVRTLVVPHLTGSRGPEGSVVLTGGFTTLTDLTGGSGAGLCFDGFDGGSKGRLSFDVI